MKVSVDTQKCIGSGMCVLHAPEVFDQRDDDGVVMLATESPAPELDSSVRESAAACPASAIHLVES
ncbi:ferredoxin [Rhodococcus artemisiae]|uniref:Ferredoxin n=1 Tax=Rhodococcus artemisiae TaxID=714159 RepID=A0ABU7LJS4_9NOCA|nr:ferredoxin [Rhodococcus artemisiae]MEE2061499.1 ferredoxin [Rhodococcus artemisiae]